MQLSVVVLSLSVFTSVFAMEAKEVRRSTQVSESLSVAEGTMVVYDQQRDVVPFVVDDLADEEVDAWLVEAVQVANDGLEMVPVRSYGNAVTILSPEALERCVNAYNSTTEVCYYTGFQLYCIAQVGLTMANNFLSAANSALDKAEEVEGGIKQVLEKAEVVIERAETVRGKFNADVQRANNILEGKKPEGKSEESS
jgi:hypothetical protein